MKYKITQNVGQLVTTEEYEFDSIDDFLVFEEFKIQMMHGLMEDPFNIDEDLIVDETTH